MTSQHIPGELLVKVDMEAHAIVSPIKSEIKFQIVGYSEDTLYKFDKDYILKYSDYVINNNFDFRLFLNTISSKINRIKLNKNSNLKFGLAIFFEEKSFFGDALRFLVYVDLIFNDTFDIVGFKNSNMIAMLHILKIKKSSLFYRNSYL